MKFEIGHKDRTYHYELETEALNGKKLGEKLKGEEISGEFSGYEFEITGASDKSGFPAKADLEGVGRKEVLLTKGFSMREKGKGLIVRKTVRGNTIADDIIQINLKVVKEGSKKISTILGKEEKVEGDGIEAKTEAKSPEHLTKKETPKPLTEEKAKPHEHVAKEAPKEEHKHQHKEEKKEA